jgi:TRAP-type C4-dicarboxylate transport system substrate-binding protein
MKALKILVFIGLLCVGAISAAHAQEHNLRISTWLPPKHGINTEIFGGLITMMEEATDKRVSGELVHGLAPPPAQMDLIIDGAADIAVIFHGYQPGRFTGTQLIELPGYEGSAEAASVAYWRVHEEHLAKLNEHRGVKLIALHTHGPGQIHSTSEVTSLAGLDGLKTRIGGGVAGNVGAELGLVGINVPAPKVYETLESGAADAVAMNVGERIGFRLNEVAPFLYDMPGGFYRGSFALIMSEDTFKDLPKDIQAALDEQVFGEPASRMAGAAWDLSDELAYKATRSAQGTKVIAASKQDQAAFDSVAEKVTADVLKELNDAGVDAQAAYGLVSSTMANY